MKEITTIVFGALALIGVVFVAAVFGGTFVWMIWPVVGKAFPGLVASGVLSGNLSWWDAVSLTWLFGMLIKSSQTNKKE